MLSYAYDSMLEMPFASLKCSCPRLHCEHGKECHTQGNVKLTMRAPDVVHFVVSRKGMSFVARGVRTSLACKIQYLPCPYVLNAGMDKMREVNEKNRKRKLAKQYNH